MRVSAYQADQVADVFKAVSDPTRVRILAMIQRVGELCVCHVESALELTQSRASRHLAALRRAGLLAMRRDGAFVHYHALDAGDALPLQGGILRTVSEQFRSDPELARDAERARECREAGDCGPGAALRAEGKRS